MKGARNTSLRLSEATKLALKQSAARDNVTLEEWAQAAIESALAEGARFSKIVVKVQPTK